MPTAHSRSSARAVSPFLGLIVLSISLCFPSRADDRQGIFLGGAVPAGSASRTINLAADTRWVNVERGESVRFVFGGTDFGWKFDGAGERAFDLRTVAPPGLLARPIMVYISSPGRR